MIRSKRLLKLVAIMLVTENVYALSQHEKAWFAMNASAPFSADKKWLYLLYSQLRLINESHPVQTGILEGALGYQLHENMSGWLGYQWAGNHPNNNFYQVNRFYEQIIWRVINNDALALTSRSRLEENIRGNESPVSIRIRERLYLELNKKWLGFINPAFFDEIFLQLNNTPFTPHKLYSENRLFLGVNLYTSKSAYWEVGYINQYQYGTPLNPENQMNHIASFTYNF